MLAIICNVVTKAGSEEEAMQIAEAVCTKLVQLPSDKPALRIKV
jgi:translation initiation factor 3 subunit M